MMLGACRTYRRTFGRTGRSLRQQTQFYCAKDIRSIQVVDTVESAHTSQSAFRRRITQLRWLLVCMCTINMAPNFSKMSDSTRDINNNKSKHHFPHLRLEDVSAAIAERHRNGPELQKLLSGVQSHLLGHETQSTHQHTYDGARTVSTNHKPHACMYTHERRVLSRTYRAQRSRASTLSLAM